MRIATLAVLLLACALPVAAQDVRALGWLAGCWVADLATASVEEQWTDARGGLLLGTSRTLRGDSAVAWEFLRIHARGGAIVYAAAPSGQPPADFTATQVSDSLVTFENAAHDFPQRIRYRRAGPDSIRARVEGTQDGRLRGFEFAFARVRCAGPAGP